MVDLLVTLLVMVVIFAVLMYIVNNFLPIDPQLKQLAMLIVGVIFLIWLLMAVAGYAPIWHGGRLR